MRVAVGDPSLSDVTSFEHCLTPLVCWLLRINQRQSLFKQTVQVQIQITTAVLGIKTRLQGWNSIPTTVPTLGPKITRTNCIGHDNNIPLTFPLLTHNSQNNQTSYKFHPERQRKKRKEEQGGEEDKKMKKKMNESVLKFTIIFVCSFNSYGQIASSKHWDLFVWSAFFPACDIMKCFWSLITFHVLFPCNHMVLIFL